MSIEITRDDQSPLVERVTHLIDEVGLEAVMAALPVTKVTLQNTTWETNLGACDYYRRCKGEEGFENGVCGFGCREEPECVTCEPAGGWPPPDQEDVWDYCGPPITYEGGDVEVWVSM